MNDKAINNLGFIFKESYDDADSFLKNITYGGELYDYFFTGDFVFRGHKSISYKLIPSVLRDNCTEIRHANFRSPNMSTTDREQLAYEFDILRSFYLKCDELGLYLPDNKRLRSGQFSFDDNGTITKDGIWLPEDLYDITALAQHYGLPTRLLDWSYEITIAIFFAISELIKEDSYNENDFIYISSVGASAVKLNELYMQTIQQLKNYILSGEINAVVVYHLNRLCRNDVIAMELKELFIDNKVQLHIKEPSINLLNIDGSVNSGAELCFALFATMNKQNAIELKAKTLTSAQEYIA